MTKARSGKVRARPKVDGGRKAGRVAKERGKDAVIIVSQKRQEKILKLEEPDGQQLLPRIPNEITLGHITPKLSWRAIHTLSLVSRAWKQAIRSRQVYEARLRSHSAETLVVFNYSPLYGDLEALALYSMRDKSLLRLPPIPGLRWGIPTSCQCISLDGKVYVLGGMKDADEPEKTVSEKVYMLDLAGQREWKQCANMLEARTCFGCGVMHGKIFVFGGTYGGPHRSIDGRGPVSGSEVYDPKEDVWSWILPLECSPRIDHHVAAVGEEFFLYGGSYLDENFFGWGIEWDALFVEIYHPAENKLRLIEPFGRGYAHDHKRMFIAQGKFHAMTPTSIYVHDDDQNENSWTEVHSFSLPDRLQDFDLYPTLAINGELIAISSWRNKKGGFYETRVLQSKGFGSQNKELVWEKGSGSLLFLDPPFMCPIQL